MLMCCLDVLIVLKFSCIVVFGLCRNRGSPLCIVSWCGILYYGPRIIRATGVEKSGDRCRLCLMTMWRMCIAWLFLCVLMWKLVMLISRRCLLSLVGS